MLPLLLQEMELPLLLDRVDGTFCFAAPFFWRHEGGRCPATTLEKAGFRITTDQLSITCLCTFDFDVPFLDDPRPAVDGALVTCGCTPALWLVEGVGGGGSDGVPPWEAGGGRVT